MTRDVFVTGGSGFVGGRLMEVLTADGVRVRALARSADAAAKIRARGGLPVRGAMTDPVGVLVEHLAQADAVVHAAAHFKLWGPPEAFSEVNERGTAALLEAARRAGVRRFVQVGAAAVVMGDPVPLLAVDEDAPLEERPWAPYSSSKARSERLVLAANAPGLFETVVVRPPLIWGRGMPMLDEMVATVRAGGFRWPGDGRQAMSTCHVDNLCAALRAALDHGAGGRAYFVADATDGYLEQVIGDLLATRGVPAPRDHVSFGAAWRMAAVLEVVWRALRRPNPPPLTRQMLRLIGMPFTVSTARARRDLRYRPVVGWQDGLAAMHESATVP